MAAEHTGPRGPLLSRGNRAGVGGLSLSNEQVTELAAVNSMNFLIAEPDGIEEQFPHRQVRLGDSRASVLSCSGEDVVKLVRQDPSERTAESPMLLCSG